MFQCSSASRKFLNLSGGEVDTQKEGSFSALQRAENSSIAYLVGKWTLKKKVSVLFSEPKIPQFVHQPSVAHQPPAFQCSSASRKFLNFQSAEQNLRTVSVSVLFSEPKIPQSGVLLPCYTPGSRFQCSSASRKFLNSTARASR